MPDLSDDAIASWVTEREPALPACLPPTTTLPARLASVIVGLGRALDTAQSSDSSRLAHILRSSPVRERMHTLLVQLDVPRRLRMLAWFGAAPMPEPHLVVESYLADTPEPGGRTLHQELQGLHRNTLLLRIFRHERITALLESCRAAGQAEEVA